MIVAIDLKSCSCIGVEVHTFQLGIEKRIAPDADAFIVFFNFGQRRCGIALTYSCGLYCA